MTMSNRKFGVEIEFILPGGNIHDVAAKVRAAGLDVAVEGYNHQTRSHWKIVTDSSCEWELVSPPLSGEEGLASIKTACKALVDGGARVNRSCGLHVHVDAAGLSVAEIKSICRRYVRFERDIDAFMPNSRRQSNSFHCGSNDRYRHYYNSDRFNTVRELANACYDRFVKLNLQAYLRHGTIEFRHHSGTVNANKIKNWVRFCLGFVEASRAVSAPRRGSSSAPVRRHRHSGFARLKTYIQNEVVGNGRAAISMETLVRDVRLEETTIRAYISNLRNEGYRIRSMRGHGYRFLRVPGDLEFPTATETTVDHANDSVFRGIDSDVVSFYQERAAEFAA